MKLQIFLEEREITSESMLRKELENRKDGKYGAFWLVDESPKLALFINNESACLYYMPENSDDKWSKNPEFTGKEEDTLDFLIENYQLDDMPLEFVIPTKQAIEAFVYFYKNHDLSSELQWL